MRNCDDFEFLVKVTYTSEKDYVSVGESCETERVQFDVLVSILYHINMSGMLVV